MKTLAGLWQRTSLSSKIERRIFHLPAQDREEEPAAGEPVGDDTGDEASPKRSVNVFKEQYDKTQAKLESIAAMDDLLSGSACTFSSGCCRCYSFLR